MIISPSRKEGTTHDGFVEYLEQKHTQLVTELSDFKRFIPSIPCASDRIGFPLDPDGTRYDVMAELQFENLEDLKAAFDSKEGRWILQNAKNFANVDENIVIAIVDENIVIAIVDETLQHQAIPSKGPSIHDLDVKVSAMYCSP